MTLYNSPGASVINSNFTDNDQVTTNAGMGVLQTNGVTITDCNFTSNQIGISLTGSTAVDTIDTLFDENNEYGVWIEGGDNNTITNCDNSAYSNFSSARREVATVLFSGRVTFLESSNDKWRARNSETMIADRKPEIVNHVMGRIDIKYMSGKKSQEVDV